MKALLSIWAGQAALQINLWQAVVVALHVLSLQLVACDVGSIAEQPAPMLGSPPAAVACLRTLLGLLLMARLLMSCCAA